MEALSLKKGISEQENIEDIIEELSLVEKASWDVCMQAQKEQLRRRLNIFSDGLYRLFDNIEQRTVAFFYFIKVKESFVKDSKTWDDITGNGFGDTYDPEGDAIFGITLGSSSSGKGRILLEKGLESIRSDEKLKNIKRIYLCGRIPSLHKYYNKDTSLDQIDKEKVYKDPTISLFRNVGFHVYEVVKDGYDIDDYSLGFSALLEQDI